MKFTMIKKNQRIQGLTLVELLVALALGLFLMGGVISIFVSNQDNFRANEGLSKIQENARFAFEQLSRDIREAGSNPCGVRTVNTVVRQPAGVIPWWADWNAGTFQGFDSARADTPVAFGTAARNRVAGTDAVLVLRTSFLDNDLRTVRAHNLTDKQLTLDSNRGFGPGNLLFICDNASGAIFTSSVISGATIVEYSNAPPSQNCSTALGWRSNVNCTANEENKQFSAGSIVTRFEPVFWYIGVGRNNLGRSLYRITIRPTGGAATVSTPDEMLTDVENLQLEHLIRTRTPGPNPATPPTFNLANDWVSDSAPSSGPFNAALGAWSPTNNNQVIATRVNLVFSNDARTDNASTIERQTIAVVSLRNREAP
jgi:type IV pilus assembly protein PilW